MKLSICIPSNRPLAEARQTIESALTLTRFEGIEVAIADNSGDDQKEAYCRSLASPCVRYLRADGTDMDANWQNARRLSSGEYILYLADDDLLFAMPGASLCDLSVPSGAVGFRPQMLMYAQGHGLYDLSSFAVTGARAGDRIKDYFKKNGGSNTTFYSAYRREVISELMDVTLDHPIRGGYKDWALVLGLLSSGEVTAHKDLAYLYNNNNWVSSEQIEHSSERAFTGAGLPSRTKMLSLLLTGIDAFILIARESSPIGMEERLEAATYTLLQYLQAFAGSVEALAAMPGTTSAQVAALKALVGSLSSPLEALMSGFQVIEQYLPGYGEKYFAYFRQVLGRAIFPGV